MNQKGFIPILIVILITLLVGGGFYVFKTEGKFCGGFAANLSQNQCPVGFTCKLDGNYPDAGGKCTNIINSLFKPTPPPPQQTTQPQSTPSDAEGKFCGGIAANLPENQCPAGYRCQLDGNYPDAGGKCVKNK